MDHLIQKAKYLVAKPRTPIVSIHNRIAYVVSHGQSYASNGYAVRTQGIAKALNGHGFEILCFVRPGRPWELGVKKSSVQPEMQVDGVRYIHSRWPQDESPGGEKARFEAAVQKFMTLFRIYRPQIVLAASNHEVGLPALTAARMLGLPFQYEVRGFWEISRISQEPGWGNTPAYKAHYDRETWVCNNAETLYTLNTMMKLELRKRGAKVPIKIVPNSVGSIGEPAAQSNEVLRQNLGIPTNAFLVGYLGAITRYEGLDQLVNAIAKLKAKNVYALIVGGNSPVNQQNNPVKDSIVDELHAQSQELGVADRIVFTGRVEHSQLQGYFAALDATVIPRSPLPVCELVSAIKPLEYLVAGKPLIASDVAPQAELLQRGQLGWLYQKGNTEALANTICTVMNAGREEIAKKTVAGRDVVANQYRWENTVRPIAEALRAERNNAVPALVGKNELRNVSKVDYATARQWFYREGILTDTLRALESLQSQGVKFDKPQRDFQAFVAGMARLKGGWPLPPRQPNPGLMTRRQRVLYCLHQSVPHATNGYSTRSHGIALGLQQAGFEVRATTRPGFPWDVSIRGLNKGYHEAEIEGVTYAACAGWSLAKTPLDYYLAEAADHYLREAQTSGAEIIVAASNHITALPALMAARRLGLPFVYEVRGLWEVTQASTQPEWAGSERYHLMRELEKQAAQEADLVITLTEELCDELASWGVARDRIIIVPNAVNSERFQPTAPDAEVAKELKLKPGVPVIGYAGSAVAYEGLELLLEALAKLSAQGQEFTFVLVGDGKAIDTVKAKAKALSIEEKCRFAGRVPFEQVPRYLSCMDIMPVPRLSSAVTEMVSPLKPLEAMAMGKAVVLSDVSPHKSMAGQNERAQLFKKDSADDLCLVLKALIDSPAERERLGQAAKAWIDQERTWNHVTRLYAQGLQRVRTASQVKATASHTSQPKRLEQITLGLIADQFTTDTLASAIKVVPLSPENWREELAKHPIDAIFVESAWKGNNWQWHRKVGYYINEEFASLRELLTHCREQDIPSLFWNKEDPIHFDRFRKAAALCDHVFTTDSRRIIPYLSTPGALTKTASSCPFYASPKIHNLLPSTQEWQPTAAYGGTYYGKRFPERTEYMDKIMSAAAPLGLTLYDRQHDDPESPYKYPSGLDSYVAGSLNYEAMIQAYKAHPVQINVNSVLDSPTMFSRRVVETAACGSPMISGPALGMNRYLEGAGHIVRTEREAAQALENLLHQPAYRWRVALRGARAIMRAHTTEHRLVQMLRTAGMVMMAPEPPAIQLVTEDITDAVTQRLLAQTLRPQRIFANQWQYGTQAKLEAAGVQCGSPQGKIAQADSLWLLADPRVLEDLEPEDLEDLAWPTLYAPQTRIGFTRNARLNEGEWPGVALEDHPIDTGLQLVRADVEQSLNDINEWAQSQPTLALRKPPRAHEQAPNVPPEKTVVIAGHDLKFIKPFYPYFSSGGIRLLLDFWSNHNQHNETASKRLVREADTVFCEWTLGNAVWYGKHKREGQKLVGRLHYQEVNHALFSDIPFEAFNTVMFVGPHILRQGIAKNPVLKKSGVVVYNGVDVAGLQSRPRKPTNGKVLGFVGIVPQRKRFDLALDILSELRKDDDGYILRIKSKRPEEYPWMASPKRREEMAWYETQYRRLEEDPLLRGAVIFDPHGNDMPEWYSKIDFALSTSDFESFHFTIADGAAAGCMPIILPWEGADEIYPKEWVYPNIIAAAKSIKDGPVDQASIKEVAERCFNIKHVSQKIIGYF